MRKHLLWFVFVAVVASVTGGCIFSPKDGEGEQKTEPPNNTPEGAILRLKWAYENKRTQAYEDMLTGDFTFEFSNASDPGLAETWSTGWFKNDEVISARNLHNGGVNLAGEPVIAATRIEFALASTVPVKDNSEGRDTLTHYVLATRVDAEIEVPENPDDPTINLIGNNFHRFFIVRGDAAVGLGERQPATTDRWYIYAWKDETAAITGPSGIQPASATPDRGVETTWGRLKDSVR